MLKILQARLQQYVNRELLMFKLVLEKTEEPEVKLPTPAGSSKKQESSRKTSISALLTMPTPSTVWITINCGKFWKRWEYQTTWPASWEPVCRSGSNSYKWTWNNRLVPNRVKSTFKAVYCHPAYLTYMQSTSGEMLGWMNNKLGSRLPKEISKNSDFQMTPHLWQKVKKN